MGPSTATSGPPSGKFCPLAQTSSYATGWGPRYLKQHRNITESWILATLITIFHMSILFETNLFHHGGPPCSGGPRAIASVAHPLIQPWVRACWKLDRRGFLCTDALIFWASSYTGHRNKQQQENAFFKQVCFFPLHRSFHAFHYTAGLALRQMPSFIRSLKKQI